MTGAGGDSGPGGPRDPLAWFDEVAARADAQYRLVRRLHLVEAVHEFRVAVKRLRALVDAASHADPSFRGRRKLRPLRRLFRACGPLRDLQVQQALVLASAEAALPGLSEYYNHLKQRERRAIADFDRVAGASPGPGLGPCRRALAALQHRLGPEGLLLRTECYVAGQGARLAALGRAEALEPATLHEVRIATKRTRYALEVLIHCRPGGRRLRAVNEALLEVHRSLGLWHDHELALAGLQRFLAERAGVPFFDRDAYDRLEAHHRASKEAALAGFHERWARLRQSLAGGGGAVR